MSVAFLSNIEPAPPGFEFRPVRKRDLLVDTVVIAVSSLDDIAAVVPDFGRRLRGCILTRGSTFASVRLGDTLWHVTVPDDWFANQKAMLPVFGEWLELATTADERGRQHDLEVSMLREQLELTRRDYNATTASLQERVQQTAELNQALAEKVDRLRRMERSLRESEENLSITVDSIGDGVIATDEARIIRRINPPASELTGWPAAEAIGRHLNEVLELIDADHRHPIPEASSGTASVTGATLLVGRQGQERVIDARSAPIRTSEGESVGLVVVFRDITEQRMLEEQLRHSQKMDSIGRLAGGVAHDFNNMLGGIMGAAEVLSLSLGEGHPAGRWVEIIIDASKRAAELTDKLLSFSRKAKVQDTKVDTHAIIAKTCSLLERSIDRRIVLRQELTALRPCVRGDPSRLQNALLNLGVNARDAMAEGGTLTFATKNVVLDAPYCEASPFELTPGQYVQISVSDTGTGMDDQTRTRAFEPFFTTKEQGKGTGLGLASVYGTMREHHGAINVHSEVGRGTAFDLCLPVDAGPDDAAADAEEAFQDTTVFEGRVLVVEDEASMRAVADEFLTSMGFSVMFAHDGEEGVRLFREYHAVIAFVLLDVVMPRMNGKEAYAAIRAVDPSARVVFCSGFPGAESLPEVGPAEGVGFVRKPYSKAELRAVIRNTLAGANRRHGMGNQ